MAASFIWLAAFITLLAPRQAAPSAALQAVTAKLSAPRYGVREQALALIPNVPRAEIEPLRDVLFATLRMETTAVRAGAAQHDEGYAEYYGVLLGAVMKTLRPDLRAAMTPARASALVEAIYNEDSAYAQELGTIGDAMVPAAQHCAASDNLDVRFSCLAVLGWLCAADNAETNSARRLNPVSHAALLQTLRTEARSGPATITRLGAVRALGYAHDAASVDLLRHIASTTPEDNQANRFFLSVVRQTIAALLLR